MSFVRVIVAVALAAICLGSHACPCAADDKSEALAQWQKDFDAEVLPIIKDKCLDCHGEDDPDGGLNLARYTDGKRATKKMQTWNLVGKRVRLNEMPPEGSPRLNVQQRRTFRVWLDSQPTQDLCGSLATDETKSFYRGYVMSRRLTRTEYKNALRDLLGAPTSTTWDLPSDGGGGEGFDTAGDTLFVSTIHVQRYFKVASKTVDTFIAADDPNSSYGAARKRLFGKTNIRQESNESDRNAEARRIVHRFARLAWRRPVVDTEIDRLMQFYTQSQNDGNDFPNSLALPLKAILVSPHFLFVVEPEPDKGGIHQLTPHQMATRLALFLWSSVPDVALLDAADAGSLATDEQILTQAQRMMADPKARALGENFGMQWLGLTQFADKTKPDAEVFPEYNSALARDLQTEAVELVASVFCKDKPVFELLDSETVFVNENLAHHYGLTWPEESSQRGEWRQLKSDQRGGVITLGAVLAKTSYPRRTSPVLRGQWMIEELLGDTMPPPPEDIPSLDEAEVAEAATLRERLEAHRKDPECAGCHNRMDPLGFGLENFDPLGRWRTHDSNVRIDASGKLPSGVEFTGPEQLKTAIMERRDDFLRHLVTKMLGFALGRELNKFDDCVVQDALESLRANEFRASAILETIVTSYPFKNRYYSVAE